MTVDLLSLVGITIGIIVLFFLIMVLRILKRILEKKERTELESASDRKIDYLYKYFRISESIEELDRFAGLYAQFLDHVEGELVELASGRIEGLEYFRRQRLVEFALNMALVYARVEGDVEVIPRIKKYWERAREIR